MESALSLQLSYLVVGWTTYYFDHSSLKFIGQDLAQFICWSEVIHHPPCPARAAMGTCLKKTIRTKRHLTIGARSIAIKPD